MNIECPQCGSTEFKKLSLVYAEGFSDLNARSRGWGLLVGSGGAELGFGKFRTRGEIQSRLSQKVSPPRKWSYWRIVFGGLIGLVVLEFILGYTDMLLRAQAHFKHQLAWLWYGWLGIVAFVLCVTFRHNIWRVPKLYRRWDRSFICRRCGHVLQLVEEIESASPKPVGEAQR